MNDQRQIHDLLETVAGPPHAGPGRDTGDDLRRARAGLRQRRRRSYSLAATGVATAAVLSIGTYAVVSGAQDPAPLATPAPSTTAPGQSVEVGEVRLVAETMVAGPYTFGTTPEGWELQNNTPLAVTIARVGDPDTDPSSFEGKVVITMDERPLGGGEPATREDRQMVVQDNGDGYTTISVRTRAGEPEGTVRLQFPDGVGWTRDAALTFLGSVEVGSDVEPSFG